MSQSLQFSYNYFSQTQVSLLDMKKYLLFLNALHSFGIDTITDNNEIRKRDQTDHEDKIKFFGSRSYDLTPNLMLRKSGK